MTDDTRQDTDAEASSARKDSAAAGVARLRDHIDRGGTADKAAASDPAAAPLGTDDEAAGAPPTWEEVALAEAAERHRAVPADHKPGPAELQGPRRRPRMISVMVLLVSIILAVLLIYGGLS